MTLALGIHQWDGRVCGSVPASAKTDLGLPGFVASRTAERMYSTCLYCKGKLGANDMLERFPIGRRIAFDAAKGRLWVVCAACARWNLTPIEERYEAIEDCERLYRSTYVRISTGNIGLARMRDGLELVRIGAPL